MCVAATLTVVDATAASDQMDFKFFAFRECQRAGCQPEIQGQTLCVVCVNSAKHTHKLFMTLSISGFYIFSCWFRFILTIVVYTRAPFVPRSNVTTLQLFKSVVMLCSAAKNLHLIFVLGTLIFLTFEVFASSLVKSTHTWRGMPLTLVSRASLQPARAAGREASQGGSSGKLV